MIYFYYVEKCEMESVPSVEIQKYFKYCNVKMLMEYEVLDFFLAQKL